MNLTLVAAIGGVALAMHYLPRRAPLLGLFVGMGLLGTVIWGATNVQRMSFQTEGSPAGMVIAVLLLSFGLVAVICGLWLSGACVRALLGKRAEHPVMREAQTEPLIPVDLDTCRVWSTDAACAAGAVREAVELAARSRHVLLVPQDERYETLLRLLDAPCPFPVVPAREFHVQRLRALAAGATHLELLTLGPLDDPRNEALVVDLLETGLSSVNRTRHLSLDDFERAGVAIGRARTAVSALRLRTDQALAHPMVREALVEARQKARLR